MFIWKYLYAMAWNIGGEYIYSESFYNVPSYDVEPI